MTENKNPDVPDRPPATEPKKFRPAVPPGPAHGPEPSTFELRQERTPAMWSLSLIMDLHEAMKVHGDDSQEVDALRVKMEKPWHQLDEREQKMARALSVGLYELDEPRPKIEDIRLLGSHGAVEVHVKVDGIWRLAIKDRCGDTETCDHFVPLEHAEDWPISDWAKPNHPG